MALTLVNYREIAHQFFEAYKARSVETWSAYGRYIRQILCEPSQQLTALKRSRRSEDPVQRRT